MKPEANYDHAFQHIRQNARRLPYDVSFSVYQRGDGTFVFGYIVKQDTNDVRFGSGASVLDCKGSLEEAEMHARSVLVKMIEDLPEQYESDRFKFRKETDESVVTDGWLIRRIYGYWPEFHDAQLLSVALRQHAVNGERQTDMELALHHWGQDNREWHGDKAHCKLTFLLEDVKGEEFATHNVADPGWINELRFTRRDDGRLEVDLEPSSGFSMLLNCATVRLLSVEPHLDKTF
ncbi:Imm50 family immunity protein [Paraburkholderia sediminicola]|uniref:Imm50 family immunity protein n=1 Tax=Paraburkholderia sediminicola TaxID=458836 RepID=UPI0038BAEC83